MSRGTPEAGSPEREEGLFDLIKETPTVLFAFDNEGVITRSEGKGLEVLGVKSGEAVGRSVLELYAGRPDILALIRHALEGEPFIATAKVGGATFEVRFAPNFDADGNRVGVIGIATDVTRQQRAEQALREFEARNAAIVQSALDAIISMDGEGRVIEFNPAAEHLFGYPRDAAVGRLFGDLIIPAHLRDRHREDLARYLATGRGPMLGKRIEMTATRADGTEVPVELTVVAVASGGPPTFTGFVRDITERKRMEEMRFQLAAIVESSDDAIVGKALDGTILTWNKGAERIYGYGADEAIGRPITMIVPEERRDEIPAMLDRVRCGLRVEHYETIRVRKDGERIHVSLTISPVKDASGRIKGASAIARDITERQRADERVRHLAFHDTLTGLPNRLLLNDRLHLAVAQAHRSQYQIAVFFLDIDRFKRVNDSLGHSVGDQLLRVVGERLAGCVREGDTVARLGGDEFIVLAPGIGSDEDAARIGGKILETIRLPFSIQHHEVLVTTSVGVALYPADGLDAGTLIRNADRAMYRAKEQGRDNCQFFGPAVGSGAPERAPAEDRRP